MTKIRKSLVHLSPTAFYPLFFVTVMLPSLDILGTKGAVMLALAALAWFVFGRLLLLAYIGFQISRALSPRLARVICSAVVDLTGLLIATRIDPRLALSAAVAALLTEIAFSLRAAARFDFRGRASR